MDFNTGQTYLILMKQHYLLQKSLVLFVFIFIQLESFAQADINYYLPDNFDYNEMIPTPQSVIGHEVGEWHVTHDKLVYYFYELANQSSRVMVEKIGQTYEYRPLLNVIITSAENHQKLEEIRLNHLKLTDPATGNVNISGMPVVVRLGYSVHGNEASGANAAMLTAYHLAAAQGADIDEILQNCIILIDPSLNPDGLQRHSTWANEHKSKNLNPDPNGREFREAWPGGRTNHYWFDLNRDWLLAQHPESIARLKVYHDWKPNVQTDHHEMGSDGTFFFQPGIPSRKNPLIPEKNVNLTEKIASYHASALDEHKRLYYTKESFDDFYFGKGSTYPDIQGGIGILFEQASVRGHLRETENGLLSFPFAIKNQFISSLSTILAAHELKDELLTFQKQYFENILAANKKSANKGIVFGTVKDPVRSGLLAQVLLRHQIEIYQINTDQSINGKKFYADRSYVIPLNQTQNTLIKAIFERNTEFQDSLFYDISAWNFDLSFHTEIEWVDDLKALGLGNDKVKEVTLPAGKILGDEGYAYAIDWNQYFAPGFLYALQRKGLLVKVAQEPFTSREGLNFDRGTLLIPVGSQNLGEEEVFELIEKYAFKYHIKVNALGSGFSLSGIDLGSSNFQRIQKPVIAMLVDQSVSGYEAGEAWHLLDQRFDMHQTMISTDDVDRVKLNRYNVLLLPGGSYSHLNAAAQERIKEWVKEGGTLVAWSDALRFLDKLKITELNFEKPFRIDSAKYSYADRPKARGAQFVGGAIFNIELDRTHPLAYGYEQDYLPVFKGGDLVIGDSKGYHKNPFWYTADPLLSGYVSKENLARIKNSPAVAVSSFGEGKVIALVDNPNFRAFWYGTNRLMMNAIFWGNTISTR
jgi:hypothetical protein